MTSRLIHKGVGWIQRIAFALPGPCGLPVACNARLLLGAEEPEIRAIPRLLARGGTAVDVGANFGFYTYALAHHFEYVHAFEPNDCLVNPIRNWDHPAVRLHVTGLSSTVGEAVLYLPVMAGVTMSGWGSLNPRWLPEAEAVVPKTITLNRLDAYELTNVRFIKIDVEGGELDVLHGAVETIKENRPVLLVEATGSSKDAVTTFVFSLGYRLGRLEELTGVRGSSQNVLLVPEEYQPPRHTLPVN